MTAAVERVLLLELLTPLAWVELPPAEEQTLPATAVAAAPLVLPGHLLLQLLLTADMHSALAVSLLPALAALLLVASAYVAA